MHTAPNICVLNLIANFVLFVRIYIVLTSLTLHVAAAVRGWISHVAKNVQATVIQYQLIIQRVMTENSLQNVDFGTMSQFRLTDRTNHTECDVTNAFCLLAWKECEM